MLQSGRRRSFGVVAFWMAAIGGTGLLFKGQPTLWERLQTTRERWSPRLKSRPKIWLPDSPVAGKPMPPVTTRLRFCRAAIPAEVLSKDGGMG